jgi:imidazolonepropionase-like amidohydrolase
MPEPSIWATLLPGFVDAHTHITQPHIADFREALIYGLRISAAERALNATQILRRTVEAGFTTVRDVGSDENIDIALRNAVRNGKIVGPRILAATRAIGTTAIATLTPDSRSASSPRPPSRRARPAVRSKCAKPPGSTSSTARM